MLILTRRLNEVIRIGDSITVRVMAIHGNKVRLGIEAPREVPVDREEVRRDKDWCLETFDDADVAVEPERR